MVMVMTGRIMGLAALLALGACAGNGGNPNGAAYATDSGGTLAVAPSSSGTVTYDPYAPGPVPGFMQTPSYGGTPRQ